MSTKKHSNNNTPISCPGNSPVQGVLEEVGLIKWPGPKQAVLNTLLVMLIVAGTSGLLFGVNTLLTELAKIAYQ